MSHADASGERAAYVVHDAADITPVSPAEFIAGVSGTQVTILLADLEIVHDYARHFDCDDDPAMIRVRKAIKDAQESVLRHGNRPQPPTS